MSDDDSLTLARQIAARAWCTDANAHKAMDVDLCDAFAHLMAAELDRLRAENMCDVCTGTGKPISNIPCMCGGTGKMSDAAVYLREEVARLRAELERVSGQYKSLIMAVGNKHHGESRHETALRYIRQAEQCTSGPGQASALAQEPPV